MTTDIAPSNLLRELQDLIQEKYGIAPADLDPHDSMREKGFDSLALVEFVFTVEDRYGIRMPDETHVDTLAELAAVVAKARAARAA